MPTPHKECKGYVLQTCTVLIKMMKKKKQEGMHNSRLWGDVSIDLSDLKRIDDSKTKSCIYDFYLYFNFYFLNFLGTVD